MNNNLGLRNSTDTVLSKNETENKDSVGAPPPPPPPRVKSKQIGEPPPPPPPRVKSKQTTEIITAREGRQFKNGIELFDENSIKEELEKLTNTNTDPKSTEPEAQEYTNSQSRFSMLPIVSFSSNEDKKIAQPPVHGRFSIPPIESFSSNEDKKIAQPPAPSRFSMPVENISLDENNQIPNHPNKFDVFNSTTVKKSSDKETS
jgi:hypothetical protein